MKIHLLSGFLGSGKTTAMQYAANTLLQQGKSVGVITNDQGIKLVDGGFFKSLNIPNRQVVNGCFCCNYNSLEHSIKSLIESDNTQIIFAESVGSCTDIIATVLKPLKHSQLNAQVTSSTFADVRLLQMILNAEQTNFDETVRYIYLKQLEEAGIIVVNKIDLISNDALQNIKQKMKEKYGDKILLYQNSHNEADIRQWLNTLDDYHHASSLKSLQIDYDIYATGEAMLCWFDAELEIFSADNNALMQSKQLINEVYAQINKHHFSIGHLKFLINGVDKISFTDTKQTAVDFEIQLSAKATVLINIRVQTDPESISQLINNCISKIEQLTSCKIIVASRACFQPGYPKPIHRIL